MKAIVAVNNLGFIGKGDQLLWHNKEDLRHFKKMTQHCSLLVGYRTAQGLPPLSNRELIVVDRRDSNTYHYEEADWCIGGKKPMRTIVISLLNYIFHTLTIIRLVM